MATLKKAYMALLVVSMLAVTTARSGPISPASSAAAGGSGAPAESSAASTATPTLDKIKATGILKVGVRVNASNPGLKNTKTDEVEGFEIGLARVITKDLLGDGSKIETQIVTTKTHDPLLDSEKIDPVIAVFTITDGRKKVYNSFDSYYSNAVKLMVEGDSGIKNLKDLDGKTIGVAQSSTSMKVTQDAVDATGIKVKFDEYTTYPEIKAALDSGRVQCFFIDGSILSGYVNDTTMILNGRYSPQEYGVTSKLDNKDLTEYANGMVARLKSSGELNRMITRRKLD